MKRRVMTIVGTRPEIIKLSRVLQELEEHTEHTLVHTGQNFDYELNEIFFSEMGIKKPDFFLDAVGDPPLCGSVPQGPADQNSGFPLPYETPVFSCVSLKSQKGNCWYHHREAMPRALPFQRSHPIWR